MKTGNQDRHTKAQAQNTNALNAMQEIANGGKEVRLFLLSMDTTSRVADLRGMSTKTDQAHESFDTVSGTPSPACPMVRGLCAPLKCALMRFEGVVDMVHEGTNPPVVAKLGQRQHPEIARLFGEARPHAHQPWISVAVKARQEGDADAGGERASADREVVGTQRHSGSRRVPGQPVVEPTSIGALV